MVLLKGWKEASRSLLCLFHCRNNVFMCGKHFVGEGSIDKGKAISYFNDLERFHMAPYLDCLSQGVSTVMGETYSRWNMANSTPRHN